MSEKISSKAIKNFFMVAFAFCLISAVYAYPTVTIESNQGTYYATGSTPVNAPRYESTNYQYNYATQTNLPRTYDYVDGYRDGYGVAATDRIYYNPYYRWTADYGIRVFEAKQRGTNFLPHPLDTRFDSRYGYYDSKYYNYPYGQYNDRYYSVYYSGKECDFGRRDICFYNYERCPSGWCRVGNPNIATYNYYNPNNIPGYYPLTDRGGIYYVNY